MWKHRPQVLLLGPATIYPGDETEAKIVVEASRPVKLEAIEVELHGREMSVISKGQHTRKNRRVVLRSRQTVREQVDIPAGTTEFTWKFSIPRNLPPSHYGETCSVRYHARVRAVIRRWFDRVELFTLDVAAPHRELPPPTPKVYATHGDGPMADFPYIECSIADEITTRGGTLRGAVSLSNVAFNRYQGVTLALQSYELARSGSNRGSYESKGPHVTYRLLDDPPAEGETVPFHIAVPENVPVSHTSKLWAVRWELLIHAHVGMIGECKLTLPIQVAPAHHTRPESGHDPLVVLPPIGSERAIRLWMALGDKYGLTYRDGILTGQHGKVEITLTGQHRGSEGRYLVADLSYPRLGIGLAIAPTSARVFGSRGALRLGRRSWDRNHDVELRSARCFDAFKRAVGDDLVDYKRVIMSDRSLSLEREDSGMRDDTLEKCLGGLISLAEILENLSTEFSRPANYEDEAEAWAQAAEAQDASFRPADIAIFGTYRKYHYDIRVEWGSETEPVGVVTELSCPQQRKMPHVGEPVTVAFESKSATAAGGDDGGSRLARALGEIYPDAERVTIDIQTAVISTPARLDDPSVFVKRMQAAIEAIRVIGEQATPYR